MSDESENEAATGADDGANHGKQRKAEELVGAAFKAGEKERQDEDRTVPDAGAKGLFSVRGKEADDDPHNAPEGARPRDLAPGCVQVCVFHRRQRVDADGCVSGGGAARQGGGYLL